MSLNPNLGMLLGATIFLVTTLDAPLTGIALVLGFTGQGGAGSSSSNLSESTIKDN